jgi:Tol biopolymer transport system component
MRGVARVAALILLTLAATAGAAPPEAPELVFASTRAPDFHDEVFSLDTRTGTLRNLSRSPTSDAEPALSPDRKRVAFVSDRGGGEAVWTMAPDGRGQRRVHAPLDRTISSLQWSRDGTWIAFETESRDPGVYVVPARGGGARRLAAAALGAAWLPGSRLAIWLNDGVVVRTAAGRQLWRRSGGLGAVSSRGEVVVESPGRLRIVGFDGRVRTTVRGRRSGTWSRDGSVLAYMFGESTIRVLDGRNRVRRLSRTPLKNPGEWSRDGRSLLAQHASSDAPLRVTVDGRTMRVGVSGGTWSPNGRSLLGGDDRGGIAVWREGSGARPLLRASFREPCPTRYGTAAWLDDRYALVTVGRGGQHDADLWSIGRDGTKLRRLRRGVDWASSPDVSADRSRLVYESGDVLTHGGGCSGLKPHLRVATLSGSGDTRLTEDEPGGSHHAPRWSPNGRLVAYARNDLSEASGFGVFVIDVESKRRERLSTGFHEHLSWAPDSRRIAFSGRGSIWVADVGAGTPTRIGSGERPEWSPDGERIAFVRGRELWTARPNGADARRLSSLRPRGKLRWSRDGTLLVFAVREGIVVLGSDGTVRRRIAHAGASQPVLSRDGAAVAYVGPVGSFSREAFSGSARTDLFVASVRDGSPRRLTRDFADVGAPSWR